MSLADKIITNRKNPFHSIHLDELGIPDKNKTIDYYCARAIKLNKYLHTEDGELYNAHEKVGEKRVDIALLTKSLKMDSITAVLIVDRLKLIVPKLDKTCIAITPRLLWNRKENTIKETKHDILTNSPW